MSRLQDGWFFTARKARPKMVLEANSRTTSQLERCSIYIRGGFNDAERGLIYEIEYRMKKKKRNCQVLRVFRVRG